MEAIQQRGKSVVEFLITEAPPGETANQDAGGGRGLAAAAVLRALPGAGEGPRSDARGPGGDGSVWGGLGSFNSPGSLYPHWLRCNMGFGFWDLGFCFWDFGFAWLRGVWGSGVTPLGVGGCPKPNSLLGLKGKGGCARRHF